MELGGTPLKVTNTIEYLGLQLTRDGFRGKDRIELSTKRNAALQMLIAEPWFTLALPTKHIVRVYQSYVRSILLYGAELLSHEDHQELEKLDNKLIGMMLGRILALGRGRLADKHRWRLQLALGLPTLQMELRTLVQGRIDAWLERRTSANSKVAYHANESLTNVNSLEDSHPPKEELHRRAFEAVNTRTMRRAQEWACLLQESKGASPTNGSRQLVAESTGLASGQEGETKTNFVEERDVVAELKKAVLRWSVYRFPIRYTPTEQETQLLAQLPQWPELDEETKNEVRGSLMEVFNAEQKKWGKHTIQYAGATDVRSQTTGRHAGVEQKRGMTQ